MTGSQSLFIKFLCHPLRVGALCPSSPYLSSSITSDLGLEGAATVVELGPGTGAITDSIIDKISTDAKFIGIELDRDLCVALRRKYPMVDIHHGSATDLPLVLAQRQLTEADVIVSGLPWAIFPASLQTAILTVVAGSLAAGGCFTTFAYIQGAWLPAGRKFRKLLGRYFDEIEVTRVVWRNLPPAFTYRCRRPKLKV